jgi:hypothetical protein
VDRLTGIIDRAPVQPAVVYLALFLLVFAVVASPAWIGRNPNASSLLSLHFLTAVWAVFPLALIHHLDRVSHRALSQFRPVCDIDDEEARRFDAALTTMPAVTAAVVGLAGGAFIWIVYLTNPGLFVPIQGSLWQFVVGMTVLTFSFAMLGVLLYHTVRQLELVSRIYGRLRSLDLFNLSPLYGFAALAARTAIAWAVALYLSLALNPDILASDIGVAAFLLQVALVLGTFAWPLIGIHRRIGENKEQALAELGESLNRSIRELSARARSMSLADVDGLYKLINSLVAAREVLTKVPTWPWSPGTPITVASALLLPVGLYLMQRVAGRLFEI